MCEGFLCKVLICASSRSFLYILIAGSGVRPRIRGMDDGERRRTLWFAMSGVGLGREIGLRSVGVMGASRALFF